MTSQGPHVGKGRGDISAFDDGGEVQDGEGNHGRSMGPGCSFANGVGGALSSSGFAVARDPTLRYRVRMGVSRSTVLFSSLVVVFSVGCSDDGGESPGGSGGTGGASGSGGAGGNPDIPAPSELRVIEPGAPTICSRDTPFRYFVRGGDPKKLVIDFQGGGACWNEFTCSIAGAIFSEAAPSKAAIEAAVQNETLGGLYRFDDPRNPVAGFTFVHIPYCTGDVHWGDATVEYSADVKIQHKGFVNAQNVLAWVYENYDPDQILVTGCSAGAYGAIGHSAWIAKQYPNAKISVLADSGCGIVSQTFFEESFPNWNAQLPLFVSALTGKDILTLQIDDLYTGIAADFPNARFAQQTSAFDKDQTSYFKAMGGDEADWSPQMQQSLADISAGAPNFSYYLAPGPVHCIHPYDLLYSRSTAGTKYADWLDQLVSGETAPTTVKCDGAACLDDAFCNACAAQTESDAACKWCADWPKP